MHAVTHVKTLKNFQLRLRFDDGTEGSVDLAHLAGKGVFSIWSDLEVFRSVKIGPYGELVWGEHVDLCPDALYLEVTGKSPEDVFPALEGENIHA